MSGKAVREQALDLLLAILKNKAYSTLALNEVLSGDSISGRNAALLTNLVYGVLQHKATLDYVLEQLISPNRKVDDWVRMILWLALYQKMYLTRIPDHAIVNEAVNLAKKRGHRGIAAFVNGVLRRFLRNGSPDFSQIQPQGKRMEVLYSHPDWLLRLWSEQWDQRAAVQIAEADNQPPDTFVRVNRRRSGAEQLIRALQQEGLRAEQGELSADCLKIKQGYIAGTAAYRTGLLTIQDQSSMLVADAVNPRPGMRVLDACAAPGGKTTHLAERMNDQGQIIALDLHVHKTKLIQNSADRLGLSCIETKAMDARDAARQFKPCSFDRVLLDVPCSGLGVIRRKPEIRWEKQPDDLIRLAEIQSEILESTAALVRPGGLLIYSTCTINRDENDHQIRSFLQRHPEFAWDDDFRDRLPARCFEASERAESGESLLQIMPYYFGSDGFFIASLKREFSH